MKKEIKKTSLNEVNVMEGIDFKANQERTRRDIEELMKQQRKDNIIFCITTGVIIAILILLLIYIDQQDIKYCMNNGHSREYCTTNI